MPTFGDTTNGDDSFPCSGDRCLVSKFTLTEDGDVTAVNVRFDATTTAGTNGKALIYDDDGVGAIPGTRKALSSAVAIPAGGGDISFPVTVSLVAGNYWLGAVCDSFQASYRVDSVDGHERRDAHTYASPAAPWGTSEFTSASTRVNAYATYTASGAVATFGYSSGLLKHRVYKPRPYAPGNAR